jgi:hypothetical protein
VSPDVYVSQSHIDDVPKTQSGARLMLSPKCTLRSTTTLMSGESGSCLVEGAKSVSPVVRMRWLSPGCHVAAMVRGEVVVEPLFCVRRVDGATTRSSAMTLMYVDAGVDVDVIGAQ